MLLDCYWYVGCVVLVICNDYVVCLYNGDVGLCLVELDGLLCVWFEMVDEYGCVSVCSFVFGMLLLYEGGFVIIVYKS